MSTQSVKVRLVLLNEAGAGNRVRVNSESFVIGRQKEVDLQLKSSSVSRRHCELRIDQQSGVMTIVDLGSRNGTQVNAEQLIADQAVRVYHHDELSIGRFVFRVSLRERESGTAIVRPQHLPADSASSSPTTLPPDSIIDALDLLAKQEFPTLPQPTYTVLGVPVANDTKPLNASPAQSTNETTIIDENKQSPKSLGDDDPEHETGTGPIDKSTPQKLPQHLVNPPTANSRDAAKDALRRHFSRGR